VCIYIILKVHHKKKLFINQTFYKAQMIINFKLQKPVPIYFFPRKMWFIWNPRIIKRCASCIILQSLSKDHSAVITYVFLSSEIQQNTFSSQCGNRWLHHITLNLFKKIKNKVQQREKMFCLCSSPWITYINILNTLTFYLTEWREIHKLQGAHHMFSLWL